VDGVTAGVEPGAGAVGCDLGALGVLRSAAGPPHATSTAPAVAAARPARMRVASTPASVRMVQWRL